MSKIVILGCGYIGTNLANYIVEKYNEDVVILGVYNEYNNYLNSKVKFIEKYIEQICEDNKEIFEDAIVIDAVGNINATNDATSSSNLFLNNSSNKIALINILAKFKIRKYIYISSGGTVYNDSNIAHKETESLNPTNIYALEKVIIENYLKIKSLEDNVFKYLILRLSNPYGGVVSKNKSQGIIDVAINKIFANEELELYGKLENIRDYIYIENVAEYICFLVKNDVYNEIFNIGSGKGVSINEIFEIIQDKTQKKLKQKIKEINTININCNVLDVNKLKKEVELNHIYSISEGIDKILLDIK